MLDKDITFLSIGLYDVLSKNLIVFFVSNNKI